MLFFQNKKVTGTGTGYTQKDLISILNGANMLKIRGEMFNKVILYGLFELFFLAQRNRVAAQKIPL